MNNYEKIAKSPSVLHLGPHDRIMMMQNVQYYQMNDVNMNMNITTCPILSIDIIMNPIGSMYPCMLYIW